MYLYEIRFFIDIKILDLYNENITSCFHISFTLNDQKDRLNVKKIEDGALSEINSNNNRSRFGKLFVEKLGQIQDINLELKKQQENSAKLKKKLMN